MGDMKNGWSFWFHSSRNASWSRDSYNFLTKTKNAEIFWGIFKYLNQSHYNSGIFFIMKEDVFPDWSSPENKDGGFISIKIDTKELHNVCKIWIEYMISNEIIEDKKDDFVQGLSISPKNGHYILKLWCNQKTKSNKLIKNLPLIHTSKFTSFSYKK
jgi:hypothetical protein|tara:strand:+ start:4927 stop:5397 length:471 start_codon:yes stop_codon:yes gene_type:complete